MDENAAVSWRVTQQVQGYGPDASGKAVDGYQVSFETARGQIGTVFVPRNLYNAATVKARVQDAAQQMDAVSMLVG